MCIYCNTKNYRKIYENHYGEIPKDLNGVSYDIHHIDGNRNNNDPLNLIALSIQEHYNIHKKQNDHLACLMLAERIGVSPEEKSELSRKSALEKSKNGTHPWQQSHVIQKTIDRNSNLIKSGIHPFQDSTKVSERNKKQLCDGSHVFLNSEIQKMNGIKGGKARKNYISITNGKEQTMIPKDKPLPEGWILGTTNKHAKNRIWVNNGTISKMVYPNDDLYKNWNRGRI